MEFYDIYSFCQEDLLIFISTVCENNDLVEEIKSLRNNYDWEGLKNYWLENIKPNLKNIFIELFADIRHNGLNEAWKVNKEYQRNKILEIFTDVISIFVPDSYFEGESSLEYDFDETYQELRQINIYTSEEMMKIIDRYVSPPPQNSFHYGIVFHSIDLVLEEGIDKEKLERVIVDYIRTGKDTSKEFDCKEYSLDV